MSEDGATYSAEEMAELLFSEVSPVHLYAAHRMLRDNRQLFKQAGRLPPQYQRRPAGEVASMRTQEEALAKVALVPLTLLPLPAWQRTSYCRQLLCTSAA